jgi:hypothetical protein
MSNASQDVNDTGVPVHEHTETGEVGAIATILIRAEQRHHERGWDKTPAMLYPVCQEAHAPRAVGLMPLGIHGEPPGEELARLAAVFTHPLAAKSMVSVYPGLPVAHVLVVEAWTCLVDEATWDEVAATGLSKPLADIPGSEEIRVGLAVVSDIVLVVHRRRGTLPRFFRFDQADSDPMTAVWSGPMLDPLRKLNNAARAAYDRYVA